MDFRPRPSPTRRQQGEPAPRPSFHPHQAPPMRVVTKGWFTMREEPKTVQELRALDEKRGS